VAGGIIPLCFWRVFIGGKDGAGSARVCQFCAPFSFGAHRPFKKILIPALLFVFAINPYLIFEHFYIRFYVFTEVLLLAVLFLGCQILLSLRSSDFKRLLASVLGFATINIIAFLWAKGMSGLPVLLASAIIMSYIFLFESKNITLPGKNLCARIGNRFLQDGFYARAVILSLAFLCWTFSISEQDIFSSSRRNHL
jgi:hypothetical protein